MVFSTGHARSCRTFRSFYEKALLDFEREELHAGEHNIPSPLNVVPMGNENSVDTLTAAICDSITIGEMMKEASASGRTPRNAAARARRRWQSKRSLGNGEVSIPVLKEKRTAQKAGSIKRKNPSAEEDVVRLFIWRLPNHAMQCWMDLIPIAYIFRVNAAIGDARLPADELKTASSPEFASAAQLKDAAEKALAVLQTQEQALTTDTLKMLAPHLKSLMSSSLSRWSSPARDLKW